MFSKQMLYFHWNLNVVQSKGINCNAFYTPQTISMIVSPCSKFKRIEICILVTEAYSTRLFNVPVNRSTLNKPQ